MNLALIILIMCSVLLSAFAQITLKIGMSSPVIQHAIASSSTMTVFQSVSTNLYVIGGLGLYFASAAVWLFVLAKVDVSFA